LKAKNFSSIVSLGLQRLSSSSLLKIGFILQSKAFRSSLKLKNGTAAIELEHFSFLFRLLNFCHLLRCRLNFFAVALRALSRTTISKGTSSSEGGFEFEFEAEAEFPRKSEAAASNLSS
jgi:hypothetical protein